MARKSNTKEPNKRSGAKYGRDKNGNPYITGWQANQKLGFFTLIASPLTEQGLKKLNASRKEKGWDIIKSLTSTSESGREYERWFAKIVNKDTGEVITTSAFFNRSEMKLYVKKLDWIVSPKSRRGGYCGRPWKNKSN